MKPLHLLILFLILIISFSLNTSVLAQSDPWSDPINLSHSGSTTDPSMVIDSDGLIYVIWVDEFDGFKYTRFDGSEWSEPIPVDFPFQEYAPRLIADNQGNIHAFWLGEENTLLYSRVLAANFGDAAAWESPRGLADSALDLSVAVDSQDRLHLGYVRDLDTDAFPAGIYYRRSDDGGASWSLGVSLYQSLYFRSLNQDQANVQLAVTDVPGNATAYVVWDDPALKRVYLAKSSDGGDTWESPYEVDGPSADTVTTAPFDIVVQPDGDNILLIWKAGLQSGFDCTQYYQWSADGGQAWGDQKVMLSDLVGCPQGNNLFRGADSLSLLFTVVQDQVFMLAWNGSSWSEPQPQSQLSSFTDLKTYESVNLSCWDTVLVGGENLVAVGCDTVGTGDIWLLSRDIGSTDDWFPPPSSWSDPLEITSASSAISSPVAVSDTQGRVHLIWTQPKEGEDNSETAIFYAVNDNGGWSYPAAVLSSPQGNARQPAVAVDSSDRLYVVWSGDQFGEMYFSWANADLAKSVQEWSAPFTLPSPQSAGSSPNILVDSTGTIYVVYAVPLNEDRGIYLMSSSDHGKTWSQPFQVFDGVAAMWDMVGQPALGWTSDGQLYLLWTHNNLPTSSRPKALYYSMSRDGGQTWSEPEVVVQQPVSWFDVVGNERYGLHRFWQSVANRVADLQSEVSVDGGTTWGSATSLISFGETPTAARIAVDSGGRFHLIQVSQELSERWVLKHLIWDGERWGGMEGLNLGEVSDSEITDMAATVSDDGQLSVCYVVAAQDAGTEATERIFCTHVSVQSSAVSTTSNSDITPLPTPEVAIPTEVPISTRESLEEPILAPTQDLSVLTKNDNLSSNGSAGEPWSGAVLGGVLAAILVVITFALRMRK